jgi:hypothetical protein
MNDMGASKSRIAAVSAPSVDLPEIVIPSADARPRLFPEILADRSFCLRVSGAVAPSAPAEAELSLTAAFLCRIDESPSMNLTACQPCRQSKKAASEETAFLRR